MSGLTPEQLLSTWELGVHRHPIDRALLLLALARPDLPPQRLADVPLGTRNAALMNLRRECFGERLYAWVDCPSCGERMEFEVDANHLPPVLADVAEPIAVDGYSFRRPTSRDLARLVAESIGPDHAAKRLLCDCATYPNVLPHDNDELTGLLDAAGAAIDDADPWADITLTVACPECGNDCDSSLDISSYLWDELDRRAQRLLDDIHFLAKAYGWTESEILALGDARRAAYLARAQA